jgi:hypothetical protein
MPEEKQSDYHRRHRRFSFIPAGALIGLGIGLLFGYPGPGVLIGLGLGFFASAFIPPMQGEPSGISHAGVRVGWVIAGIILILIGIGIVYTPLIMWQYLIASFLIVLGLWFLIRGYFREK